MSKNPNKHKLTKTDVRKYVKKGGVDCPYCGHYDIQGGSINIDLGRAHQEMTCNNCDAQWDDGYTLDSVLPEERDYFVYPNDK